MTSDAAVASAPSRPRTLASRVSSAVETAYTKARRRLEPNLANSRTLWLAFAVVHLALLLIAVWRPGRSVGDLNTYWQWVEHAWRTGRWPGISADWVYPVLALPAMVIGAVGRLLGGVAGFVIVWFALVAALNALAIRALLRRERGTLAAWWWVGLIGLLGPVAIGRVDALVAPLVIVALVRAVDSPRSASALLAVGAWIKVFPGFLLLPLAIASRRPWREVVAPVLGVCALVAGLVATLGGTSHLLSFVSQQDGRGLQVESVAATPWMLAGLFTSAVERGFNDQIITYEVTGPGTATMTRLLGLALPIAVIVVAGVLVRWRRASGRRFWVGMARTEFLTRGSLLMVLALLVSNKVGSPQFIGWLAAPVAAAVALGLPGWRRIGLAVWGVAAATQVIFPWTYFEVVYGGPGITLLLAARNLALVVLLVAQVRWFWRVPRLADSGRARSPILDAAGGVRSLQPR